MAARLGSRVECLAQIIPIAELFAENDLMDRDDIAVLLDPERLSGQDTSVPQLKRRYSSPKHSTRD
jgi:hypothetical protein